MRVKKPGFFSFDAAPAGLPRAWPNLYNDTIRRQQARMVSLAIEQELHRQLSDLPGPKQQQVLDFARALSMATPRGVEGSSLLAFSGCIPAEDLTELRAAIDEDCRPEAR